MPLVFKPVTTERVEDRVGSVERSDGLHRLRFGQDGRRSASDEIATDAPPQNLRQRATDLVGDNRENPSCARSVRALSIPSGLSVRALLGSGFVCVGVFNAAFVALNATCT